MATLEQPLWLPIRSALNTSIQAPASKSQGLGLKAGGLEGFNKTGGEEVSKSDNDQGTVQPSVPIWGTNVIGVLCLFGILGRLICIQIHPHPHGNNRALATRTYQ